MARSAMCDKNHWAESFNPVGIEKPMASPQTSFGTPLKTAKNPVTPLQLLMLNGL
jgi:hypothetical protein